MKKRGQNEGTVFVRADGYVVGRLSLGVVDGKRKQKTIYGPPGTTSEEMRRRLRALQVKLDAGQPIPTGKDSVGAFLDRWIVFLENGGRIRPRPLDGYRRYVS